MADVERRYPITIYEDYYGLIVCPQIVMMANDNSNFLDFTLMKEEKAFTTTGYTATVEITRPDASTGTYGDIINTGIGFSWEMPLSALNQAGQFMCSLQIYKDGRRYTTYKFKYKVMAAVTNNADIIANEQYPVLGSLIKQTQDLYDKSMNLSVGNANAEMVAARKGETDLPTKIGKIDSSLADNTNLACIIRQDIATGVWSLLNDAGHIPQHVASVTQDANQITINYDKNYSKIKSFVACPDDVFCKTGLQFGGDVGTAYANIIIGKSSPISGLVMSKSTGGFDVLDGIGFDASKVSYGVYATPGVKTIKITHEKALTPTAPVIVTAFNKDTKYDVVPYNLNSTSTEFMLVPRKKKYTAVFKALGNVFSIDTDKSDTGFSVISFTNGTLFVNTPWLDKPSLSVNCSAFPVLVTPWSFDNLNLKMYLFDTNINTQLTTVPDGFEVRVTVEGDLANLPTDLTDGDVSFSFIRPSLMSGVTINPSTIMPDGNNIWVYGLMAE